MKEKRRWGRRGLSGLLVGALILLSGTGIQPHADATAQQEDTAVPAPISGEGEPVDPEASRIRVAENERFVLDYDQIGADIYITDKHSGTIWSNTISKDYYTDEDANENFMTHLLSLSLADPEGSVSQMHLFSHDENSDFTITEKLNSRENKLILTIEPDDTGVCFELHFWLDETGFCYSLPEESIRESGDYKITQITVLPGFGAAVPGEDGYILYPDGSGALVRFDSHKQASPLSTYPLYGPDEQDLELLENNDRQDTYNMMLPVFGISRSDGGFLAAVTQGAADTNLNIARPGYQLETYRAYFTFVYRRFVSLEINDKEVIELMPASNGGTRSVRYLLLDAQQRDYAAMASAYRNMLVADGVLTKQTQREGVPMALDLFGAATEKGFFFEKNLKATSFAQAADILADLHEQNVVHIQATMLAWSQGGYENMPTTPSPSSALGGKSGMKKLAETAADTGTTLYWNVETLLARKGKGSFNDKKDVIRNYYGNILTFENQFLLNPVKVLDRALDNILNKKEKGLENLQLSSVGRYVIPDYVKSGFTGRQSIEQAYSAGMDKIKKSGRFLTVEGGNAYVLPYADRLNGIPDTDSRYYISDGSVPFFQMVVHGYLDYTSVAGNLSYRFEQQKLRWIEYGCTPYFILTWENPILLKDSAYNKLFTSQYSVWKERVTATAEEFNRRLGDVWNQEMIGHAALSEDVVRVTYADGSHTYINYGGEPVQIEGHTIPAEDYLVVRG